MKWLKPLTNLFKKKVEAPTPEPVPAPKAEEPKVIVPKKKVMNQEELAVMRKKAGEDRPDNWKTRKLNMEQKMFLVDCISQCLSDNETVAAVQEKYGVSVSASNIVNYKKGKKWGPIIAKKREQYLADLQATPGFHKKIRMERKEQIYHEAKRTGKIKEALAALDSQKEELEERGNSAPVSFVFQQYNNLSDEELNERYQKALDKVKKHQGIIDIQQENKNGNG